MHHAFAILLTVAAVQAMPWFQETPPVQEFDLDQWEESFEKHVSEEEDSLAILELGTLTREYSRLDEKLQKAAAKVVAGGLDHRRAEEDDSLFTAVVSSLGELGEQGSRNLLRALRHRNVDKRTPVLEAAVEALGVPGDLRAIDTLESYLFHKDAVVIAAAARGLGKFEKAPERDRKQIVEQILKQYSAIYANSLPASKKEREAGQRLPRTDEDTYKTVKSHFDAALRSLTGERLESSSDWYRWFNENRKKRWDEDSP